MICIVCILLIFAVMPLGYYFAGPIVIIAGSMVILYLGYRITCGGRCYGKMPDMQHAKKQKHKRKKSV